MDDLHQRFLVWGICDSPLISDDSPYDDRSSLDYDSSSDTGVSSEGGRDAISLPRTGRRSVYRNDFKLRMIEAKKKGTSVALLAKENGIKSPSAIHNWSKREAAIRAACANKQKSKVTLGGQGRKTMFPREEEVVQWIKDMRREDFPLKTAHVVEFLKEDYATWTSTYMQTRREDSLHRLVRRLIARHGFSFRVPTRSVLSVEELMAEQVAFADSVGASVSSIYSRDSIFNADETAVYFDESPGLIIAERGSSKSSKVKGRKQSYRATVLLTVSASGEKLPPLIIFKGRQGGTVEDSFAEFPSGAYYAVQDNAWMDGDVWHDTVINKLWSDYVYAKCRGPLAIYVDNFRSHVSDKSMEAFASLGTELVPLPTNTTAVLQPLDVGIMGPFKKKLRGLGLARELSFLRDRSERPLRERLLALRKTPAEQKRRGIAEKVLKAWNSVSTDSVRQAWLKSGLCKEE